MEAPAGPTRARRRWLRRLAVVVALGAALLALVYAFRHRVVGEVLDFPEFTHEEGEHRAFMLPMADGVELYTQVFLPQGEGPWPVVLVRSPYDVADSFATLCGLFVRYGYGCVYQDVRGRMRSQGEWVPMYNERADGITTLDWLVKQDFMNGNIALFGMSYLASVQWAVADVLPPEVKTMVPMVYGMDGYGAQYEGGLFKHEVITAWAALMPDRDMHLGNGAAYHAATRYRPAKDVDEKFFGVRLPWYETWIEADTRGAAFWNREDVRFMRLQPARTRVPVLILGGWFDVFLGPQLKDVARLATRAESRVLIGPWHHLQFSDSAQPNDIGLGGEWREVLEWLDHHLKGRPYARETGVIVTYAMGAGTWHTRPDFPPPTQPARWSLDALEASLGCPGGRLVTGPVPTATVAYRYDPDDPVPSQGGGALLAFAFGTFDGVRPGAVAQDERCDRQDVLTFRTEPVQQSLHIAGPVQVELTVSSSAPDTAFTAKLIQEGPDGSRVNIRDGAITLAMRGGEDRRRPYTPGDRVEVRIETWPIEWVVPPGARLVLEVSSSNFPALHAHPNRYGPWAEQDGADVATNRVHGGSLILPIWEDPT
ncbi:MAG: CocE/NonD family hydrolase [Myxococcales bacterium]|nr:CocE/NonD family hydrolase [Myxococcales bacterium]